MPLFSKHRGTPTEKKQLVSLLTFIVDSTLNTPAHHANVPAALCAKIEKLEPGLIELLTPSTVADPAGNILMKATAKGIEAVHPGSATAAAPAAAAAPAKQSLFVLESGFAVPPSRRGIIKEDIYPFAQMEVGQSFFVAATEERPNPAKALASTVSSATKRYVATFPEGHEKAGQSTGKDGRKFTVRARIAGEDGEKANGARVYRVA